MSTILNLDKAFKVTNVVHSEGNSTDLYCSHIYKNEDAFVSKDEYCRCSLCGYVKKFNTEDEQVKHFEFRKELASKINLFNEEKHKRDSNNKESLEKLDELERRINEMIDKFKG